MSTLTGEPAQREGLPVQQESSRGPLALWTGLSIVFGAGVGHLASGDIPVLAFLAPLLLVPVLIWRQPRAAVYVLLAAAVTVEQFGYTVGPREGAFTAKIPAFHGVLPAGINPVEVLMLLTAVVVVMQAVQRGRAWLHKSPVLTGLLVLLVLVLGFFVVGISRGGDMTMALWEVRPYIYLIVAYLLASALIADFKAVRPLLWVIVLGSGAKALYGLVIFWDVKDLEPRPEAVLGHEESFFFGLFIILTAGFWLFAVRDRLRTVATVLLPFVLLGDMVNSRRTAWLIIISGLAVLMFVAYAQLPQRRRTIGALMAAVALGAALYLPAFWNQSGTIAQPARAVRSAVAPDSRDEASNQYRDIEDYNIKVRIAQSRGLGLGYGVKLQYFGLVDLTKDAPLLAYVPHNGVLYQWLRIGLFGMLAFTLFLANAMISAVRLAADHRPEVAMIGGVVASALVGYVGMGITDMGFFWFRNAIAMGLLLGVVDGLARSGRRRARPDGDPAPTTGLPRSDCPSRREQMTATPSGEAS